MNGHSKALADFFAEMDNHRRILVESSALAAAILAVAPEPWWRPALRRLRIEIAIVVSEWRVWQ